MNDGHEKSGQVLVGEILPGKATQSKARLNTIGEIRREAAKVYNEARSGTLQSGEATRFTYILNVIATLIRDGELENRVKALEQEKGRIGR